MPMRCANPEEQSGRARSADAAAPGLARLAFLLGSRYALSPGRTRSAIQHGCRPLVARRTRLNRTEGNCQ
jgi:hypothetical protein